MKTIAKALKVLQHFTPEHEEWGVTELARATDIHKVIMHRILRSFAAERFLVQDSKTRRYRLGDGLFRLVRNNLRNVDVVDVARPHLELLRAETNETVVMTVRFGLRVVVAEVLESSQIVRVTGALGNQAPIHCSAAGKLFLSLGPDTLLDEQLVQGLKAYTPRTITTVSGLKKELAQAMKRGWAVDDEESVVGIRSIAAPVLGGDGGVEACIAVRVPTARLPRSGFRRLGARVAACGNLVSEEMQQLLRV